jgi:hypothetical protein
VGDLNFVAAPLLLRPFGCEDTTFSPIVKHKRKEKVKNGGVKLTTTKIAPNLRVVAKSNATPPHLSANRPVRAMVTRADPGFTSTKKTFLLRRM